MMLSRCSRVINERRAKGIMTPTLLSSSFVSLLASVDAEGSVKDSEASSMMRMKLMYSKGRMRQ